MIRERKKKKKEKEKRGKEIIYIETEDAILIRKKKVVVAE